MTGQAAATDLYALLGVPSDADDAAIKKAYRRRARVLHPDRNPDDPDADAKFSAVREAYEVLSDASRRREYDQRRRRPRPPPAARPAPAAAPRPVYRPPRPSPDGRRLEFDVTARPPSTPDLSAPDRWSRGVGAAVAVGVVALVVAHRGTGTVAAVGTTTLTLAVLTLLALLLVHTGRPRRGRLHIVVGPGSLTFPARRRRWLRPATAWSVALVGLLGASLASTHDVSLTALWRLSLLVLLFLTTAVTRVLGAAAVRSATSRTVWFPTGWLARGRPPELTITAEGVAYVKGSAFWSCRWAELVEIGAPTLTGATRLTTTRSRVRLGAHRLDSDTALVLQILTFYAANLQARHEIGVGAVPRLLRGDFDTVV